MDDSLPWSRAVVATGRGRETDVSSRRFERDENGDTNETAIIDGHVVILLLPAGKEDNGDGTGWSNAAAAAAATAAEVRRRRRYSGRAAAATHERIMKTRCECAFPRRERFELLLLLLFFIVGRHSPSLIKSRTTPRRHLVLIRTTNAAVESSRCLRNRALVRPVARQSALGAP